MPLLLIACPWSLSIPPENKKSDVSSYFRGIERQSVA